MGNQGYRGRTHYGLWLGLAVASLCATACSISNPVLEVADLPPLELDSDSVFFKGRNLTTTDISLRGKVSPLVESLQLSFDNGATWVSPNSISVASFQKSHAPASQSNTPFTVTVSQIGVLNAAFANTMFGKRAKVLIRGAGAFGNTAPAEFEVLRTNYQSYGVFGVAQRGGINKTLAGGQLKVRGGQVVARAHQTGTGQLRARGGLQ